MDAIEIQVFEADTKASKGITSAHLQDIASGYDSEKSPAPLVWGHPANDSPALGIIESVRAEGSKLFAKVKDIAKEVIDAAKANRIINRSVAIWAPDHPSNPNPGKYALRHLGLLGGQAPAIPNMPRLRFSADESALESEEGPADAIIFAPEEPKPTGVQTVSEPARKEEPVMEFSAEQIAEMKAKADRADAAEAEAKELREANEKREREFAAAEKARREGENAAVLDKAVEEGKLLPAEKDDLAAIFNALPVQALTFAEGGEMEPRQRLAKFLEALPKRTAVSDGQKSPEGEFSASDNKAKADKALEDANKRAASAWKAPAKADA